MSFQGATSEALLREAAVDALVIPAAHATADGIAVSATVVAVNKALVATVSPSLFVELLKRHPSMLMTVTRRLARIVRTCDDRIMDLSTLGAVQRVYVELLRMARPDAAGAGFG